jgi:hypothetical protein
LFSVGDRPFLYPSAAGHTQRSGPTNLVGILNAQQELATGSFREEVVEKGCS